MPAMPSERQMQVLRQLLGQKDGLTIDELVEALSITRPAVRQHLVMLEGDGLVAPGPLRKTLGRPVRPYQLTPKGHALFPKQYAWFSTLLLESMRQERGSEGLAQWLRDIARTLATGLQAGKPERSTALRVAETVQAMNDLQYQASETVVDEPGLSATIEATHCVYHDLATRFPEVCQFDLQLLESLTGAEVRHEECMVKGGSRCRFTLREHHGP